MDHPLYRWLLHLFVFVAIPFTLASQTAVNWQARSHINQQTDLLNVHSARIERLTSETHDLRDRVLHLERPDEPVHPPRHPGRIGGQPVIPWIEPWSGSRPTLGTEIGDAGDQPIGTIDRR